ncbi:MAG: hypothetical protein ACQEXX_14270 [Bacillota bacterium]
MLENDISIEPIEIDSLVSMIKMAYSFENWERVISLSTTLLDSVKDIRLEQSQLIKTNKRLNRHISYYFGYSYLMKGLAHQKLKQYSKSIECVSYYADLSWLDDKTESAKIVIEDFHFFSRANSLTLEILTGNKYKMSEYIDYLENNSDQVLSGLITILESAIVHHFNIDNEISLLMRHVRDYSFYKEQVIASKYLSLQYMLALYNYLNKKYSYALDYTIHSLVASDKLNNDKYFKKSVALFEILKTHASVPQLTEYSNILNKIFKGEMENEESLNFSSYFVGSSEQ